MVLLDKSSENATNIKTRTFKGFFWSANSKFSIQIFNLIITAILARLLSPEDFGTVGMSLIFIGLVSMINETGLSSAIIQKANITGSHLNTAFWTNVATGIMLFLASIFISPIISDFFKNDNVELIIIISSIGFLISPLTMIHRSLLVKNLEFKKLAATEITGSALSGIIAVYMAISGFGLWSLVARYLMNDFLVVSLTALLYPWKPSIHFSKKSFLDLFGFGVNIMGANFLGYFRQNLDYIIVGRLMGAELLGYYTLAYTLAIYPIRKIGPIITRVMFPVFSLMKDDNELYKKSYLKLISFLCTITIPTMFGLVSISREFVILIYGEKWAFSILPLQILCLLGIVNALSPSAVTIFNSKGVPEIEFKLSLIKLPITAFALIIGSFFGIVGVATAMTIISIIYYIVTQKIVLSLINLSWKEYISSIKVPLIASFLMFIIVTIYKNMLYRLEFFNNATILISSIFVGIIVYTALTLHYNKKIVYDIKKYKQQYAHQRK